MDSVEKKGLGVDELEALFKCISSAKLLEFRLISKGWNGVAKLVLRKRCNIKLLLTTGNNEGKTNQKFLQFLNNSPETAFIAPVMHVKNTIPSNQDDNLDGETCGAFETVKEICKILGTRRRVIRKLILEECCKNNFTWDFFLVILQNLSPSLEKLEIFQLNLLLEVPSKTPEFQLPLLRKIRLEEEFAGNNYKNFLKLILKLSPNLTSVFGHLKDLNLIPMLRETGRLSKMRAIMLTTQEDLDIVLECQPKIILQKLQIEADNLDAEKLQRFLQEQRSGLKVLQFFKLPELDPVDEVSLPLLPLLENLRFTPRYTGDSFFKLVNGENTPKLRSLSIFSDNYKTDFEEQSVDAPLRPCLFLEKLELNMQLQDMTPEERQKMLEAMGNTFPHIKKLQLNIHSEEFQFPEFKLIPKCWPNLEDIEIDFELIETVDLDEVLFGLSAEWKESIATTKYGWWVNVPAEPTAGGGIITNLKNLRRLDIANVVSDKCEVVFTDFSAYCGFWHLESLQQIHIFLRGTSTHGVSSAAVDVLRKNLPNLKTFGIATGENGCWTWF